MSDFFDKTAALPILDNVIFTYPTLSGLPEDADGIPILETIMPITKMILSCPSDLTQTIPTDIFGSGLPEPSVPNLEHLPLRMNLPSVVPVPPKLAFAVKHPETYQTFYGLTRAMSTLGNQCPPGHPLMRDLEGLIREVTSVVKCYSALNPERSHTLLPEFLNEPQDHPPVNPQEQPPKRGPSSNQSSSPSKKHKHRDI
jgi:hypothetical protein